jgi:hypothetical protein
LAVQEGVPRAMDDGSSYRISTMAEFFDIVIVVERDRKTK